MTQAEFFERFDRHIERMDTHVEVANGHMARGNELMARLEELFRDHRTFTRDLTRRNEVVLQGMMREMADGREQIQANTRAVLKVLDRLEPQSG